MGVYRVPIDLEWTGPGSPGVNVFHIRTANDIPPWGEVQDAVDAIHAFYTAANSGVDQLSPLFAGGTVISCDEAMNVETQEAVPVSFPEITSAATIGDLPAANQLVVSWRTSLRARRGMGRTFLGPLNMSVVEADGSPNPTILAQVRAAAAGLIDASSGVNDWAVGVWGLETPHTGDLPDPPRVLRDFTSYTVADQFAVLRSRRD